MERLLDTKLASGLSPRSVQYIHANHLTMDAYSHVMPSLLQDPADAMDRALTPGPR